jgi:hypothetical protein
MERNIHMEAYNAKRVKQLEKMLRSCRDAMKFAPGPTDWSHMVEAITKVLKP